MLQQIVSARGAYLLFFKNRPFFEFLLLGVVTGLTLFPLVGIQAVLLLTIPRLLYLLDTPVPWPQFFLRLWGFGLGFFCLSLYWICQALFVEIDVFWWLVPFCFFGLPALLSFIMSFLSFWFLGWSYTTSSKFLRVVFLQFGYANIKSVGRLLMLALWWVSGEYFLTSFWTGFPWALVGYTWSSTLVVAQVASLGSIYTLTFLTFSIAGIPYLYYSLFPSRAKTLYIRWAVGVVLAVVAFGSIRLMNPTEYTDIKVRLVQPSIQQTPVWRLEEQLANLNKLISLSQSQWEGVNIIIWPEAALGFYLEEEALHYRLAQVVPPNGYLILGAIRRNQVEGKNWNSIYILNEKGKIEGVYDKHHLVPFGEYIPLRSWLEKIFPKQKIRKVTSGLLDFSEGPGPKTFSLKGIPSVGPIICYEAIFPGQITSVDNRPQWLLHLTNDSWFGTSFGPQQHFEIARMRAIEEGLPVVRVANSGISGVIDPYGRVLKTMPLGSCGAIDMALPKALSSAPLCGQFFCLLGWFDKIDPFSSRKR